MQLYLLGRRLTKIGESTFVGPSIAALPAGVALILADVFAHPGTSISEVVQRTGLPQGHVSKSVARFRDRGAVTTAADPADRRRTLVTPTASARDAVALQGAAIIDAALTEALGGASPAAVQATVALLEDLAARLTSTAGAPVVPDGRRPHGTAGGPGAGS